MGPGPAGVKPNATILGLLPLNGINAKKATANLARARALYGAPDSQLPFGASCHTYWNAAGLTLDSFSFAGGGPCADDGLLYALIATKPGWYTTRGLAIGDSASDVATLYPEATTYLGPSDPTLESNSSTSTSNPLRGMFGGMIVKQTRHGLGVSAHLENGVVTRLQFENFIGD